MLLSYTPVGSPRQWLWLAAATVDSYKNSRISLTVERQHELEGCYRPVEPVLWFRLFCSAAVVSQQAPASALLSLLEFPPSAPAP